MWVNWCLDNLVLCNAAVVELQSMLGLGVCFGNLDQNG